jgi:signal transduction histidine kinase
MSNIRWSWLPSGKTLPDHQWEVRHRGMVLLLWAHVVALPLLALAYGRSVGHSIFEGSIIAVFAVPSSLLTSGWRRPRTLIVTFGLLTCSATLVHIMNGAIEAHFHYFVIVTVLALYEDWTAYGSAIGYVLLQHGVGSAFARHSIFNHDGNAWTWAAVHAGFIAALSIANIVNWRAAERLRAETEAHAHELERSNRELEEFAYVASHDLAEPLRVITSYLQLIDRQAKLDETSQQYLTSTVSAAKRMHRLIDDLLRYSRSGTGELHVQHVPAADIVAETMRDLAAEIEAAGAVVEVGDLPAVNGDPVLLGQLFQNLVANAVKFRDEDAPHVHVTGREVPDGVEFTVRDNGIGIAPEDTERVFKMFHRLHHREQYEGTGIGLAVCQRIVERHGGEIHIESEGNGSGTSFVFTVRGAGSPA